MAIPAYVKKTWVNGGAPAISAANLQNISDQVDAITDVLDGTDTDGLDSVPMGKVTPAEGNFTDLEVTGEVQADIDMGGFSLPACQSVANLAARGPAYYLDGVNDFISLDALALELNDAGNTEGAIVWKGKIHDFTTSGGRIWCFADTNATELLEIYVPEDDYKIICDIRIAGTIQWEFKINDVLEEDVEYEIVLAHDGVSPVLYVNRKIISITFSDETDKTVWFAGTTGIDNARLGCWSINSYGNLNFLNCTVNKFYALNVCPTAAEVLEMFEGGNVPFEWVGASQTLVLDDDCADDDTGDWDVDPSATLTFDTDHYELGNTVNQHGCRIEASPTVPGKLYSVTLDIKDGTGTDKQLLVDFRDYGTSATWADAIITTTAAWVTHTFNGIALDVDGGMKIKGNEDFGGTNVEIRNISIKQIGCVAQLEQNGIGHNQWLDNSGNKLHGEVSGALPINLSPSHKEQYPHLTSITGNTAWTDVVPAGYMLNYIVFEGENANDATIDLGTTASTDDVFSQEVIAGNDITIVVINKMFSKTAAQSLYLNDAGAGSWNGASLLATLYMSRVEV